MVAPLAIWPQSESRQPSAGGIVAITPGGRGYERRRHRGTATAKHVISASSPKLRHAPGPAESKAAERLGDLDRRRGCGRRGVVGDQAVNISDPEVWRVAQMVVGRFGLGASAHAAGKAKEAFANGEREDAVAWTKIYEAIGKLLLGMPGPGDTLH